MNEVYAAYFPAGMRPARTCVGVTALAGCAGGIDWSPPIVPQFLMFR